MHKMIKYALVMLPLLTGLAACYEPEEGCLDYRAVNYDVTADDACPDCCTYPALKLALRHQAVWPPNPDTSISFKYNTPYASPFDKFHYFKVERFRFFISGLHLINSNGQAYVLPDSLSFSSPNNGSFKAENNFTVADRDLIQTATLGTFITEGIYNKVELTIGLPEEILTASAHELPSGHPLSTADTLLYDTLSGYRHGLVMLYRDTLGSPPEAFTFAASQQLKLDLPELLEVKPGHHTKITLTINYLVLFDGVDFKNDAAQTIRDKVFQNMPNAINVTDAVLE